MPGKSLPGWKASAQSLTEVTDQQSASGTQSLQVGGGEDGGFVERTFSPAADGVTFIDFWILPTVDLNAPAVSVDVDGAMIGFEAAEEDQAEVVCALPEAAAGTENDLRTGREFGIDERGQASEWLRLTIRQDRKAGVWDLFVNGELSAANLPLKADAKKRGSLQFIGGPEATYVDDVQIAGKNMLFPDSDKDGLSDAFEKANQLNPFFNDRDADRDLDGTSNIAEVLQGTRPDIAGTTMCRIIYVDNIVGRNVNSGESLNGSMGASGPKFSLKDAMRAAKSGDLIMVLRGAGTYREGPSAMPGGDFTIMFEDENTILNFD